MTTTERLRSVLSGLLSGLLVGAVCARLGYSAGEARGCGDQTVDYSHGFAAGQAQVRAKRLSMSGAAPGVAVDFKRVPLFAIDEGGTMTEWTCMLTFTRPDSDFRQQGIAAKFEHQLRAPESWCAIEATP